MEEGSSCCSASTIGDLLLRAVAVLDEDLAEALAGGVLVAERLLELLDREGGVA